MQSAPAILLASLLSAALTAGVVLFLQHEPARAHTDEAPPVTASADPALEERLGAIEQRLGELARTASSSAPAARREDTLTRSDVEGIVREILAQPRASAPQDSAFEALPDFDLEASFAKLLGEGLDYDARSAIFQRAKKAGQLDELIEKLRLRSRDNPAIAQAHLELGQAYLEKLEGMPPSQETGQIANAADQAFDRALEADPKHWEARFLKAVSLSFWPPMFGKQAEAVSHLETLRTQQEQDTRRPHHVQTYQVLGNLYSVQGKDDKAREIWEEGLRRFPQDEELRQRLSGR